MSKSNEHLGFAECAASGHSCSYGPHGPKGEMQCEYCGAARPYGGRPYPPLPEVMTRTGHGSLIPRWQAIEQMERYVDADRAAAWQPMATVPTSGMILLTVEDAWGKRRVFPAEASFEDGNLRWMVTVGWTGWTRLHSGWTPVLWQRWPEAPVKDAKREGGAQ